MQKDLCLRRPRLLRAGQQRFHHHIRTVASHRSVFRTNRRHDHGLVGPGRHLQENHRAGQPGRVPQRDRARHRFSVRAPSNDRYQYTINKIIQ